MSHVSIIIPAYNEEKRIEPTIQKYLSYYQSQYPNNFEILVVLNGCTDNTLAIVKKYADKHDEIHYLNYPEPIGKGGAIAKGFKYAKGEFVGYTDADMSTRPEIMHRLLRVIEVLPDVECVIGSRELNNSKVVGKENARKIMSKGFNFGVNFLFNLGIKDTQCGAKLLRKEVINKILPSLTVTNMAFDVNLLVDVKRANGDIIEVPIEWEDADKSTIKNPIKVSVAMALSVVRLRLIYSPFRPLMMLFKQKSYQFLLPENKKLPIKVLKDKNIPAKNINISTVSTSYEVK
jgi:glycosyltransferase involved in cell wall biosynthesis